VIAGIVDSNGKQTGAIAVKAVRGIGGRKAGGELKTNGLLGKPKFITREKRAKKKRRFSPSTCKSGGHQQKQAWGKP